MLSLTLADTYQNIQENVSLIHRPVIETFYDKSTASKMEYTSRVNHEKIMVSYRYTDCNLCNEEMLQQNLTNILTI